jgi:hypothetical protein
MKRIKTFLVIITCLVISEKVESCICFNPDISKILPETEAIFIGKVVAYDEVYSIEYREKLYITEFEVIKYWRGGSLKFQNLPKYVTIAQVWLGGGCGKENFEQGKEYLIYAPYKLGFLFTSACGNRVLKQQSPDFKQDMDSLKILGFEEVKPMFEDSFSVIKEKERFISTYIDSLKKSYEGKIKQIADNQLDIWERRIYWIIIFLLMIYLLIVLRKSKKANIK